MPQICYAFTGLTASAPQMGRNLYDKVLSVRNAMDRADKIFAPEGFKVTRACFLGTPEELARPSVAVPAQFAIQYGIVEALRSRRIQPQFACASGLAELAMAACLGGIGFEEAIRAARDMAKRREASQEAALPALSEASSGAYQLFSLKSGARAPTWKELFAEQAWNAEPEAGLAAAAGAMRAMGLDTFIEIGPGELLGPRVRAVDNGIRILATTDAKSLATTLKLAL